MLFSTVDPLTDKSSAFIYTWAVDTLSGAQNDEAGVTIFCGPSQAALHLVGIRVADWIDLGAGYFVQADYRLDDMPVVENNLWNLFGHDRVLVPSRVSEAWVNELLAGHELLMLRLRLLSGASLTFHFSLDGLSEAVEKLGCE